MNEERVIKFRGQSIARAYTDKWLYGGYCKSKKGKLYIMVATVPYEVAPKSVGQFTGFTDISGNEIFEDDFIQNDEHPDIVLRVAMLHGCWMTEDDPESLCWILRHAPFKVIGNAFDNPELLKGGAVDD